MYMHKRRYTVYRHTSPNGKSYIGITGRRVEERWAQGNGYRNNTYFSKAIKKYGWENFEHEILLEGLTKEEAELAERLFIGYWDLTNRDKGYNIEHGGNAVGKVSNETKKKISDALQGENGYWYGQKFSDIHRKRLSDSHRGKPSARRGIKMSEEQKKKISQSLKGEKNSRYKIPRTDDEKYKIMMGNPRRKEVAMLDANKNDIIKVFNSMGEASRKMHISQGNIWLCCNNKRRTASGYKWKYLEDINL